MKTVYSLLLILLATSITNLSAQLNNEPDAYQTSEGTLTVHPVYHGSVAFTYQEMTIFVDPFGGAERFQAMGDPDVIFITDIHGDHLNEETLGGLQTSGTTFVVPQAVADRMENIPNAEVLVVGNGEEREVIGMNVRAIPMYNLPDDESSRHKKGRGNGYVITFGDMIVYLSGDTEDIPEMRSLEDIDIAFVCMNLPYTMDLYQAAGAVTTFKPAVMYPYHHRGQDIELFRKIVNLSKVETEVVLKDWYSE